jgi:aspartate/methionine/tyrosine aminotransferase
MKIADFKLEHFFRKYEFSVEYMMGSSDCESLSIGELLSFEPDASIEFHKRWLGYTESKGDDKLRNEIANIYESMNYDQILVHAGAEEVIFLFLHATIEAGDHAIVHWPCYQSLFEVTSSIGCQVTKWCAREENSWELDLDELRSYIKPNTKVIIINTPHNPTGYLMSKKKFQELNNIAQSNGIIIFSDEVYRESEYSIEDRLPAMCDINDNSVSLGVMSKTYGLAGLRIGWTATKNTEIFNKILTLKDYTSICNSAPSEFLATLALRNRDKIIKRNLQIIKNNLILLDSFFEKHNDKLKWVKPKAGATAFPAVIGEDIELICEELIKSCNVLILPGTIYNDDGNHFRLGFARKNFHEALNLFENFISLRK